MGTDIQIDLGAEKLIGAQRNKDLIAVEVKSFIGPSLVYDFHLALGQYMNYVRGLRKADPTRLLYLAVPETAYVSFFVKADVSEAVKEFKINLLVYSDLKQEIVNWFKAY
ncbi:XisH protein [Fibrisoma limi BUZ 3]|uniref:XisH protein n=1 Tax=Fibrisoma limi BUZ 3 TaxID=1185876 RepID=I2GRV2_9BACT|nr:XisH protein [Fibrisoma limi BUZ 3]